MPGELAAVWPRPIHACVFAGCKYVEAGPATGIPPMCPAHHVQCVLVQVEPTKLTR